MRRPRVEVSNPERVVFPAGEDGVGVTKRELVTYYRGIADVMMPHIRGRPLVFERFPDGIAAHGLLQSDFAEDLPPWLERTGVRTRAGLAVHPLVEHPEDLAWLANHDCTTVYRFLSRHPRLELPDRLVFDLDPGADGQFDLVRAAAQAFGEILDRLGLPAFLLLTGCRGLHVMVPIRVGVGHDEVRAFAQDLAAYVADQDPDHRTTTHASAERGDRVFIDTSCNGPSRAVVAPYAVRSRPGAPVATPLRWDELDDPNLAPDAFPLGAIRDRLIRRGDPWHAVGRHAHQLDDPRRRLAELLARVH